MVLSSTVRLVAVELTGQMVTRGVLKAVTSGARLFAVRKKRTRLRLVEERFMAGVATALLPAVLLAVRFVV